MKKSAANGCIRHVILLWSNLRVLFFYGDVWDASGNYSEIWKNTCAFVECRISCEFLLTNFILFAHATMFEQNNLIWIWKFPNNLFWQTSVLLCALSVFSNVSNILISGSTWWICISSEFFPSRVGWEGFAPFVTENFSFSLPLLRNFTHPQKHFLYGLQKATPFGPEGRKVLKLSPMKKSAANGCIRHVILLWSNLRVLFFYGDVWDASGNYSEIWKNTCAFVECRISIPGS